MIEDLIKQREEIDLKIKELKKEEPFFQSFERIKKFEALIASTKKLIGYEISDNPFITKMLKYGFNTDLSLFPYKLAFKHISEDSSFKFALQTQKMEDIVAIDDVRLRVLKEFLESQFKK